VESGQGARRCPGARDGRNVLGTNDPTLTADTQLATSKQRDVSEKRYLEGPLAVRPLFFWPGDAPRCASGEQAVPVG
jgi:hypothetical protein